MKGHYNMKKSTAIHIGLVVIGAALGTCMSVVTKNIAMLPIGVSLGLSLGMLIYSKFNKKDEE
mgnify:FL=1